MGFGILPEFKSERKAIGGILRSINNIWDHLNVEHKVHDYTLDTTAVTGAQFKSLIDIDVGITGRSENEINQGYRDGNKIRVKGVQVKAFIRAQATTAQNVHVLLLKHYENMDGVGPTFDNLYDPNTGVQEFTRLRNLDHKRQYKILDSRIIRLSGTNSENQDTNMLVNMYHRPKRVGSYVEWAGSEATSPSNGKYYLVWWTNTATPAVFQFTSRVTFIDN